MPALHETAYPRIRSNLSRLEVEKIFTPTTEEILFATRHTKSSATMLGLLVLLKTFQRLGYFPQFVDVPPAVIKHIARSTQITVTPTTLRFYEDNGYRYRHMPIIRDRLGIQSFSNGGLKILIHALASAAQSKDDLADLVNCALETLVAKRYELPGFSTLVRAGKKVRHTVNRASYLMVYSSLTDDQKCKLDDLFFIVCDGEASKWQDLKRDPGLATQKNMRNLISHLEWLHSFNTERVSLQNVPFARYQRYVSEARAANLSRMKAFAVEKRLSLAAVLIRSRVETTCDDLVDMFIKSCKKMHRKALGRLEQMQRQRRSQTDSLIELLARVTECWTQSESIDTKVQALNQIYEQSQSKDVLEKCREHLAYSSNNWIPLLPPLFNSRRKNFLRFARALDVVSSNQDKRLERALKFCVSIYPSRSRRIAVFDYAVFCKVDNKNLEHELAWIPDQWWRSVAGSRDRSVLPMDLNRKMLEACLFTCVMQDFKSGDLFVTNAGKYGDWRQDLISEDDSVLAVSSFCKKVGLPTTPDQIADFIRSRLSEAIQKADNFFPKNEHLEFKDGVLTLKKLKAAPLPAGLRELKYKLSMHMPLTNIPQILADTDKWIGWSRNFRSISSSEVRMQSLTERYISTTFCYGCNLGPTQTERSLIGSNRKQIVWTDEHQITDESLQESIVDVINTYHKLLLPKLWGDGSRASADGTQWEIFEKNLLSEYHVRYGGWGGIGYYHVSDTYIALFSNFISCGVWEGVHILDGIVGNKSDIKPDILHADTQGQSEAIFGLAALLGIQLMPRIRNWKDLEFYLPHAKFEVTNLESLFLSTIDWHLITSHMMDMLRVAVSVSRGTVAPSTILRRLNSSSRKNKLYYAFRELGRAVRTTFLAEYITDVELRHKIQGATNISEAWNGFSQWVGFGGSALRKRDRQGQQKLIRYNHLVANLIAVHNTVHLTKCLSQFALEGDKISPELVGCLSPYRTENINRFGEYDVVACEHGIDINELNLSLRINS